MAVKLHRCKNIWIKLGGHPCWRVQKALDAQAIDYEIVKYPWPDRRRADIQRATGQKKYPVIQFEDGSLYHEESEAMAARIRAGKLFDAQGDQGSPAASQPTST